MKTRIILTNFFVLLLSLSILVLCSSLVISRISDDNTNKEIKNYLNIAVSIYDGDNMSYVSSVMTQNNDEIRVTYLSRESGLILGDYGYGVSNETEGSSHLTRPEVMNLGTIYRRYSSTTGKTMIYICALDEGVYLRIALPASNVDSIKKTFNGYAVMTLILIMIISTVINVFVSKGTLKPLNDQVKKLGEIVGDDVLYQGDNISELSSKIEDVGKLINKKIIDISNEKDKVNYIINNIDQGMVILDGNKNIILINNVALKAFDKKYDEIIDKNYLYLIQDNKFMESIDYAYGRNMELSCELAIENKTYLINMNPLESKWSMVSDKAGLAIIMIDISKINRIERMKKDFFSNASHELKSPLTTIIGYLQMMNCDYFASEEEKNEAVSNSIKAAKRMSNIITDMLELSYLESDMTVSTEKINMADIVREQVNQFVNKANEKKININTSLDDCYVNMALSDADYLLGNLIDNAVKYNKENGLIDIVLSDNRLIIKDSGIGISEQDQTRVFERFYRVDKRLSQNMGGTGLGLSIVKHVCNRYGFKLSLESKEGIGTTFTIDFKDSL